MTNFKGETIWLIGASSGIGAALAKSLAALGAKLILSARRGDELQQLNAMINGQHQVMPLDVADAKQVNAAAQKLQQYNTRIDRVIFMAAIYKPCNIAAHDADFAKQLIDVNVLGAMYTTYAVLPLFAVQGKGQLAICASIAGYSGLPGGQPYSASKAALINFTESLYAEVDDSIDIKLINPGFVRTRITDKNKFHMPALLEPEQAAHCIARGLLQPAFEIHFPKRFTYWVKLLGALPYWLKLPILRYLRKRAG
jgi:short-subunit dehydrogenase